MSPYIAESSVRITQVVLRTAKQIKAIDNNTPTIDEEQIIKIKHHNTCNILNYAQINTLTT